MPHQCPTNDEGKALSAMPSLRHWWGIRHFPPVGEPRAPDILCESAARPLGRRWPNPYLLRQEPSMDESKIPIQPQAGQGGQAGQPQPGQPQQVQIPVDVSERDIVYMNFFQAHMNSDEVYLDLG